MVKRSSEFKNTKKLTFELQLTDILLIHALF